MVTRSARILSVHRVVRDVLQVRIPTSRRDHWIGLSLRLLTKYLPLDFEREETLATWELLHLHATNAIEEAERRGIAGLNGPYDTVRRIMKLTSTEHIFGTFGLVSMGLLLQDVRELVDVGPFIPKVLEDIDAQFQEHFPLGAAILLRVLAMMLRDMDRLPEAKELLQRSLYILETSLGPDHPNTRKVRGTLDALIAKMRPDEPA